LNIKRQNSLQEAKDNLENRISRNSKQILAGILHYFLTTREFSFSVV